jgi:23S rRNA (pseudouridine1915-N3)-methyltransferase
MRIRLLFPGKARPRALEQATDLYLARLQRAGIELANYGAGKTGGLPENRVREEEGGRLLQKVNPSDFLVLCDERGRTVRTDDLVLFLRQLKEGGGPAAGRTRVIIALGGAFGVSEAVRQRADDSWSLSGMVLAGGVARVVLLEGLYRARCILDGHPYHNA